MVEILLPNGVGRKVRFWTADLPEVAAVPAHARRIEQLVTDVTGTAMQTRAAVEVFRPAGPSFQWSAGRRVDAASCEQADHCCADGVGGDGPTLPSIVGRIARFGDRWTAAVIAGIQSIGRSSLPSGRLTFSSMAHGAVGSSPIVFKLLAKAVVRLLLRDGEPQTADEAAALLP